ncbi:unnamed protein product [Prunus armeniaca]
MMPPPVSTRHREPPATRPDPFEPSAFPHHFPTSLSRRRPRSSSETGEKPAGFNRISKLSFSVVRLPNRTIKALGHQLTRRRDLPKVQRARTNHVAFGYDDVHGHPGCLRILSVAFSLVSMLDSCPTSSMVPGLVWSEDADQVDQGPLNPTRLQLGLTLCHRDLRGRVTNGCRRASESHHWAFPHPALPRFDVGFLASQVVTSFKKGNQVNCARHPPGVDHEQGSARIPRWNLGRVLSPYMALGFPVYGEIM